MLNKSHTKNLSLNEKLWRIFLEKSQGNVPVDWKQQQQQNGNSNGSRKKNKRPESREESIDSPEIPDKGETSDIPGLPSGSSYDDDVYLYNDGDEEVKVDGATKWMSGESACTYIYVHSTNILKIAKVKSRPGSGWSFCGETRRKIRRRRRRWWWWW